METTNKITINGITVPDGTDVKTVVENGNLVITFQKQESEVKEPPFKKGDVFFLNVQGDNKIYQHIIIDKSIYGNRYHVYVDFCINENKLYSGYERGWFSKEDIKSIRYATDEEKRTLFLAMLKEGLFWDSESEDVKTLKDGDIISVSTIRFGNITGFTGWTCLFRKIVLGNIHCYGGIASNGHVFIIPNVLDDISNIYGIRLSTDKEKKKMLDTILQDKNVVWNPEKKDFEKSRFRANKEGIYWYISETGTVGEEMERDSW